MARKGFARHIPCELVSLHPCGSKDTRNVLEKSNKRPPITVAIGGFLGNVSRGVDPSRAVIPCPAEQENTTTVRWFTHPSPHRTSLRTSKPIRYTRHHRRSGAKLAPASAVIGIPCSPAQIVNEMNTEHAAVRRSEIHTEAQA